MQWDDLRIFLAVARAQSLSAAGRMLKLDPATVGRRISRLEQELGAPLFAKSPQGYALSATGARLLDHAERAEAAINMARDAAEGNSEAAGPGLSGQIRIGAPDGCANFLLPQVCAQISAENPDLDLQVVALPRVFNLSKREADMAIAVSAPQTGRMTVQKITDYRLHLAAHKKYLRSAPPLSALSDLRAHKIIGYIPDMIFDKELDYLAELGADRISFGSNSVSVQFQFVQSGAGVGIVHDFALPFGRGLQRVLPEALSLTRSFYLIRPEGDRKVDRLNRLATALAQGLKREVERLEALV
ncbi:MAG: DNA-binding transcriptional LysR family regulator [Halocynthiibacter sp.]|jgi:DNA-binding transcriptional LysR family regulator